MTKTELSTFPRPDKQQQQRSVALVVASLREQARYEIQTISRTIAIIHRALRESDSYENQKRLGAIIGELTSVAHLIETEVEHNIAHSFDTSEIDVEKHRSIV
ncbi:MAG TPA: hypothetical protein VFE96_02100 [Candidatus Bathyarchaeia archaeon]|nr:hypothetical protein [Candidatus Bathyarchaeia archaeon]